MASKELPAIHGSDHAWFGPDPIPDVLKITSNDSSVTVAHADPFTWDLSVAAPAGWQTFTPVIHCVGTGSTDPGGANGFGNYLIVGDIAFVTMAIQWDTLPFGSTAGAGGMWEIDTIPSAIYPNGPQVFGEASFLDNTLGNPSHRVKLLPAFSGSGGTSKWRFAYYETKIDATFKAIIETGIAHLGGGGGSAVEPHWYGPDNANVATDTVDMAGLTLQYLAQLNVALIYGI